MERFNKSGQPIELMDDIMYTSGITWVNAGISTKNTTDSWQVASLSLVSSPDFFVSSAAGMLYCKLLSPARVLEWMLVDGLKKNLYWAPAPEKETAFIQ